MKRKIKREIFEGLIKHAQNDLPLEACGYLGEKNGIITEMILLRNVDMSGIHFTFEPAEQFDAIRVLRDKGLKVAAVYHSHPLTPARPSEEDIRLAYDPNVSYVIISLKDENPEIRSFKIKKNRVTVEELVIID